MHEATSSCAQIPPRSSRLPALAYISLSPPHYYFCRVTGAAAPTGAVEIGVNLENTTSSCTLEKPHVFVIPRQPSHAA